MCNRQAGITTVLAVGLTDGILGEPYYKHRNLFIYYLFIYSVLSVTYN